MAFRDKALIIDSLGNNWNANSTPAAGATCSASVTPAVKERIHLNQLGWSIRNAQAAAYAATLNVRHASIGGTVIGSWDIQAAAGGGLQDSWAVNLMGKRGVPLNVDFGVPASSVTQKVSIAGWRDTLSDG